MKNISRLTIVFMALFSAYQVQAQFTPLNSNLYFNTGNVGIGTNSPVRPLDLRGGVAGSTNSRLLRLAEANNIDRYDFSLETDNFLRLNNGISDAVIMAWGKDGKVGIGTTAPRDIFQIKNTYIFHDGGHKVLGIGWSPGQSTDIDPNGHSAEIRLDPANGLLRLGVSASTTTSPDTRMTINGTGAVGIGTNAPAARLHVENGSIQIGSSTQNGMLYLGGNKGYSSIGATRSDGALMLGYNVYARYDNAIYNGKALVGTAGPSGFSGIKLGRNGQIDFFGKSGNVNADEEANHANNIKMSISTNGNLGIGTNTPGEKLEVAGNALIDGDVYTKKVEVSVSPGNWPDYVFESSYDLKPLSEVEAYIIANKHLPEVPSAKEIGEKGLDLGSMDATLLKKMEEMTLYMIEMKKEIEALKKENKALKKAIDQK